MNQAVICGFLGADPELKHTTGGAAVATFNVATSESWTDKSGEKKEETDWHRVVVWDKLADNCKKYLAKGRQVLVTGRIRTRSYDDKDGVKRYVTEIVARNVQFIGAGAGQGQSRVPAPGDDARPAATPAGASYAPQQSGQSFDEIPF